MRIQHNVTAMNSYRNFSTNNSSLAKNLEKLSSGYKINRAGDDAAGLAISEKMRAQISGLGGATKNAKDGISLVQTAEGALTEVHDMLNRMYTLAEQSANGTYEDAVDRSQLQKEVDQLRTEIDRIADSANFNGLKLLDGSLSTREGSTTVSSDFVDAASDVQKLTAMDFSAADPTVEKENDFAAFAGDDSPAKIAKVGGSLGTSTIPKGTAAVAAAKSEFTVNFNDYAVAHAGTVTLKIGDADEVTVSIEANDILNINENDALATKFLNAINALNDNQGLKIGDNYYTAALTTANDDNKLVFTSDADAALTNALPVSITSSALEFTDSDEVEGEKTGATVSFAWNAEATNAVKDAFAVKSDALSVGVSVEQKLATLENTGLTYANTSGATITTAGDPVDFTNTTAAEGRTLTYNGNPGADIANGDTGSPAAAEAGYAYHYIKDAEYKSADDKATIKLAAVDGYTYKAKQASDDVLTDFTAALTGAGASATANTAATMKVDVNNKVEIGVYDGEDNLVGTLTIDLSTVDTEAQHANFNTVTLDADTETHAAAVADNGMSVDVTKDTSGVNPGGTYNTSTEVITLGSEAVPAGNLASTVLDGSAFEGQIKDGSVMQIGDEKYIFSVGADSKYTEDAAYKEAVPNANGGAGTPAQTVGEVYTVVDLTDMEAGDEGLTATALQRLTVEAADNDMFSVGYNATDNKLTLVENEGYVAGTGVDLTTAEGIQEQIKFGSATTTYVDGANAAFGDTIADGTVVSVDGKNYLFAVGAESEYVNTDGSPITSFEGKDVSVVDMTHTETANKNDALQALADTIGATASFDSGTGRLAIEGAQKIDIGKVNTADSAYLEDGNFKDAIKDGSTLQIGATKYVFAVGQESTVKEDGESVVIDMKDVEVARKTGALNAENVSAALDKLASAAADNKTFSVAHEDGKLSFTAKDKTLDTREEIQDQIKFGSVEQGEKTVAAGKSLTLQIGDTSEEFNKLKLNIRDMHTDSIGTYEEGDESMTLVQGKSIKDIDIGSQEGAAEALDVIKNAINMVSDVRGTLGASQNRLEHTINNLGVMRENIQNAESAIRDTDVAEEMMAYTKNNILVQSAQAMLAQANQLPQGVLQLLG